MPKATATPITPDLGPAIARLRQIVAEAGDHLLLGDGAPNRDAELLELCGDALHHLVAASAAYDARPWHTHKVELNEERQRSRCAMRSCMAECWRAMPALQNETDEQQPRSCAQARPRASMPRRSLCGRRSSGAARFRHVARGRACLPAPGCARRCGRRGRVRSDGATPMGACRRRPLLRSLPVRADPA